MIKKTILTICCVFHFGVKKQSGNVADLCAQWSWRGPVGMSEGRVLTPVPPPAASDAVADGVPAEVHEALRVAMEKLQLRFTTLMQEKVDLRERVEELEHRCIQLSGETDTIGEAVTRPVLYRPCTAHCTYLPCTVPPCPVLYHPAQHCTDLISIQLKKSSFHTMFNFCRWNILQQKTTMYGISFYMSLDLSR